MAEERGDNIINQPTTPENAAGPERQTGNDLRQAIRFYIGIAPGFDSLSPETKEELNKHKVTIEKEGRPVDITLEDGFKEMNTAISEFARGQSSERIKSALLMMDKLTEGLEDPNDPQKGKARDILITSLFGRGNKEEGEERYKMFRESLASAQSGEADWNKSADDLGLSEEEMTLFRNILGNGGRRQTGDPSDPERPDSGAGNGTQAGGAGGADGIPPDGGEIIGGGPEGPDERDIGRLEGLYNKMMNKLDDPQWWKDRGWNLITLIIVLFGAFAGAVGRTAFAIEQLNERARASQIG